MARTHFGYESVDEREKARRLRRLFDAAAPHYDRTSDLMSGGLHRAWKARAVLAAGVQQGERVLDVASGTGDLARALAARVGADGLVLHTDLNEAMLRAGRDRLLDAGLLLPSVACDGQVLPFADGQFDLVTVAFGLRDMVDPAAALREMARVLRTGGRLLVLEFSQVVAPLRGFYDWYSFRVLPVLERVAARNSRSAGYLAESIRMHPGPRELKALMQASGFGHVDWQRLSGGVVALHRGIKCAAPAEADTGADNPEHEPA